MNRRRVHSAHAAAGLAIVLVSGLASCSDSEQGAAGATSEASTPAPTGGGASAPSVSATATATYSSDRVGAAMQWFVGQMNTDLVESDLDGRFSSAFTDQVSPGQIIVLIGDLRLMGPWVMENAATQGSDGTATLVSEQGTRYTLSMQLDEFGLITGMLLNSVSDATTSP